MKSNARLYHKAMRSTAQFAEVYMKGCDTDHAREKAHRHVIWIAALVAIVSCVPTGLAQTSTQPIRVPFATVFEPPCAGEPVAFTGEILISISTSQDANGFHYTFHINTQGVKGQGLITTGQYIFVEGQDQEINTNFAQSEFTLTQRQRVTAPLPNNNFYMTIVFHMTINANSVPTADVSKAEAGCD